MFYVDHVKSLLTQQAIATEFTERLMRTCTRNSLLWRRIGGEKFESCTFTLLGSNVYRHLTVFTNPPNQDSRCENSPEDGQNMEFPGGKVPFTDALKFQGGKLLQKAPIPCYRTLDSDGGLIEGATVPRDLSQEKAELIYKTMVSLQTLDTIFYEAQRQVCNMHAYLTG